MSPLYRNIFFSLGVIAVIIMFFSFNLSWAELITHVRRAGIWLPASLVLWFFIYTINAWSWSVLINNNSKQIIGFWRILKYTITGYALNEVTPVGVLGGEPYRIMELKPYLGIEKATSCVLLYAMMHIFSHFCFWAFSILLYLWLYWNSITIAIGGLIVLLSGFVLLGIYFFVRGYKYGLANRAMKWFSLLPLIGKRIALWQARYQEDITRIDQQIIQLHAQDKKSFHLSLWLEFTARVVGCLELMFIMLIMTDSISFADCILMQAFSSLLANLIFFIPMQMGTREGSLALFTNGMKMNGGYGVLTGLIMRIREIVWVIIGMGLIKLGNKTQS